MASDAGRRGVTTGALFIAHRPDVDVVPPRASMATRARAGGGESARARVEGSSARARLGRSGGGGGGVRGRKTLVSASISLGRARGGTRARSAAEKESEGRVTDGASDRTSSSIVEAEIVDGEVLDVMGRREAESSGVTSGTTLFGVPMSPEVYAIALVYFVQGVIGLSRLAKDFYLKDELHLGPSETAMILSIAQTPWLVKPLWGFLSDSVPIFGYRRKSYLLLCGAIGCLGWSSMATWVDSPETALVAFTLGSLSIAFSDVIIDSIVVAKARGEEQGVSGSLQSLCWGFVALGSIVSSYFSGSLIETYGTRFVFGATAMFPLLIAGASTLVQEKPVPATTRSRDGVIGDFKEMTGKIFKVAKRREIWAPALFVFLYQATPSAGTAMFYFNTNELGFTPEFLGRVSLLRAIAALGGVALYNGYLKRVPLKKMFFWGTVAGTVLGSTQLLLISRMNLELGISDKVFALTDTAVLTVLGEVSFLPVLVLAAKLCPEGVEATFFAALMSLFNAGGVTSEFLGAGLTKQLGVTADNFDNLFLLASICIVCNLLPLAAINLVDEAKDEPTSVDEGELESGTKKA